MLGQARCPNRVGGLQDLLAYRRTVAAGKILEFRAANLET